MYDKFQNYKTKNLDFTEIYKLVEPIKKLEEEDCFPDIYFIGKTLKDYVDFPEDYEIKAFIEHAAQLSDYSEEGFRIHESLPSIVPSPFRVSVIESVPGNNGAYSVGPYIAYAKSALSKDELKSEKKRLGKNLLVFPAHSIRGLNATYDIDSFCNKIKSVSNNYDSVRICLYWKDVILGTAEKYINHGFEVVTAGHYYDPMFMPRLKSIIETSTTTMSNNLGTHVGYCIYLNKPHYFIESEINIEMNPDDGKELAHLEYEITSKVRKKLENEDIILLKKLFSKNEEIITKEQYQIINKYWGLNEIKTKKELTKILLELEEKFQKNKCKKAIFTIENNSKTEIESIIKSKNSIITDHKEKIRDLNRVISLKNNEIKLKNEKINLLVNSNSWKITKPLRKFSKMLKL